MNRAGTPQTLQGLFRRSAGILARRREGLKSVDFVEEVDAARILPALVAVGCCGSSRDWTHGVSRRRFVGGAKTNRPVGNDSGATTQR